MRTPRFESPGINLPGYDVVSSKDIRQSLFDIHDFGLPNRPQSLVSTNSTVSVPKVSTTAFPGLAVAAGAQAAGNFTSSISNGLFGLFGARERFSHEQKLQQKNLDLERTKLSQFDSHFNQGLSFSKTQFGESTRRFNESLSLGARGVSLQENQFKAALQSAKSLGIAYGQSVPSIGFQTARLGGLQRGIGNGSGPLSV